jgi:hypothetical protein
MPDPVPADTKLDSLLEQLAAFNSKLSAPPPPSPPREPERVAPPDPSMTLDAVSEKFDELIAAGKNREAFALTQKFNQLQQAPAYAQVAKSLADNNRDYLRRTYGETYSKREDLFNAFCREKNLTDAHLADRSLIDEAFRACLAIKDREGWLKEHTDTVLTAAKAQWESDQAKLHPVAQSPPITAIVTQFEEKERDRVGRVLSDWGLDDTKEGRESLARFQATFAAYNANLTSHGKPPITWAEVVRQCEKESDPRYSVLYGAGHFRKRASTMIGDFPTGPQVTR